MSTCMQLWEALLSAEWITATYWGFTLPLSVYLAPTASNLSAKVARQLSWLLHALQGYGTVRFSTKEEAEKAITDFNGTDLEGRALAVKIDKCAPAALSHAEPGNRVT